MNDSDSIWNHMANADVLRVDKNISTLRSVQAAFYKFKARVRNGMINNNNNPNLDWEDRVSMNRDLESYWTGVVNFMREIERVCNLPEGSLLSKKDVDIVLPKASEAVNA